MPSRTKILIGGTSPQPSYPVGQQRALKPASKAAVHQSQIPPDLIVGSGRRIVARVGLFGGDSFLVADGTDPDNGGMGYGSDPVYPEEDEGRVILRMTDHDLTPGCYLRARALAVPSGPYHEDGGAPWFFGGAGGRIQIAVTYDNGTDTQTETKSIVLKASEEDDAAEPSDAGGSWLELFEETLGLPPEGNAFWLNKTKNEKWSKPGMTFDLVVTAFKSPRLVDLIIYEEPRRITQDDEAADWVWSGYTPHTQTGYPYQYPVTQGEESGNVTGGSNILLTSEADIASKLGPVLWTWSAHTEHINTLLEWVSYGASATGDDEAPPWAVTGTTPTRIWPDGSATDSWAEALAAAGCGSGANGRLFRDNQDWGFGLRGRTGVIPVWVRTYSKASTGDTATTRVLTKPWSMIEVPQTSTSYGWVARPGWLTVGVGPEQDVGIQLYGYGSDASATLSLRYVQIHWRRDR